MVRAARRRAAIYRAWESVGEQICRILQQKISGLIAQRRTLLYAARGAGDRGRLAPTLQYATTASCAGVSATRPRDRHLRADQLVGVKELKMVA